MPEHSRILKITIPPAIGFADLKLKRDLTDGSVSFDWHPIEEICRASGIDLACFRDSPEDNVAGLIMAWYVAHRKQGGVADPVEEELLREVAIEDAMGLYKVHLGGEN